ncbi:FAD-binding protein [Nocardia mexicana]|uniref:FAD/FMN-containing dehydrogenase n=1 Tax=Nocardia mexicana TaxID=279262 RepID=A0A370HH92_9NOCA|nr:FAD-binding protein [Nocardia mexicana]RDI54544.1 FAD/FMN-containing dehydrogenase [Nocardia mexicana]
MPSAFPSALLGSGRPLTIRGAGHSCDGQTVTDGELLVTYAPKSAAPQVREVGDGLVEVPVGMSWYGLERYLNRRGRSFPVLPNYLHMSVGGTLSVGGIGIDSVRRGMQVDHVDRIQLIDGTGTSRWCSRVDHPELFRFALAGLGTVGLIERAVLHTVPYQRETHLHRTNHASLAELAEHTEEIARRGDADIYWAMLRRGRISSVVGWRGSDSRCDTEDCAVVSDLTFARHPDTGQSSRNSDRVRMWADYVVPAGQLAPMLERVEAMTRKSPLAHVPTMLYSLIVRRGTGSTSFAFSPAGTAPVSIGVGVYTSPDRDSAAIVAVRRVFRELLQLCCELGGRPYLYGVADLDGSLADSLYGPELDRLAHLRSAHHLEHLNAHLPLVQAAAGRPADRAR